MKSIIYLTVLSFALLFAYPSFSQSENTRRLKKELALTENPVRRFEILIKILENEDAYQVNQIDSSACAELLRIAQSQKNDAMLATSYNWIGYYLFINKGDNAAGLEYFFKALPLAEKVGDKRRTSSICFDIAGVYNALKNKQEYLNYTRRGGRNLPDTSAPKYNYMLVQYQRNMANYFLEINQLDSAQYYGKGLSQTSKKLNTTVFTSQALSYNARLSIKLGQFEKAELYSKELQTLTDSLTSSRISLFYEGYVPFLMDQGRFQEAQILAQRFWERANHSGNKNIQLSAAQLKRKLFEKLNIADSAYEYLKAELTVKDLIFNQNNQNLIQSLAFKEQLRGIEEEGRKAAFYTQLKLYILLGGLAIFSLIALLLFRNNLSRRKANELLQQQKTEVEVQKKIVEEALSNLKSTQTQLIQSEKMASLGELTAGIAHEIQNPLNFVNNFSELNKELIRDLQSEIRNNNLDEVHALATSIESNSEKINHHGKRAAEIVKGMLQHSSTSSGKKEPTDINALADEYLRLVYHGLRAKDKSLNAMFETHLDPTMPKINLIPQDIGRVLVNLINNAFYAVSEKSNLESQKPNSSYKPTVILSTHYSISPDNRKVEAIIRVKDNGNGITDAIKEKIFQPFFTTKPTGQGTGLGLSLSYDIIKAHGGTVDLSSTEGEGTLFTVRLPV